MGSSQQLVLSIDPISSSVMAKGLCSKVTADKLEELVTKIAELTNQNNQVHTSILDLTTRITSLEDKEVLSTLNHTSTVFPHYIPQETRYHQPRFH